MFEFIVKEWNIRQTYLAAMIAPWMQAMLCQKLKKKALWCWVITWMKNNFMINLTFYVQNVEKITN